VRWIIYQGVQHVKRILLGALVVLGLVLSLTGCDARSMSRDAIRQNFPQSQHEKAYRVAECESGMNPRAVSPGGGNWGLFQINTVHKPMVRSMGYDWDSQIRDPYVNSKVARRIWNDAGGSWRPWACRYA